MITILKLWAATQWRCNIIYTSEQIEHEVSQLGGTHVKRNNARKKLISQSNNCVTSRIENLRSEIRALRAAGVKERDLSPVFSKITQLEMRIL